MVASKQVRGLDLETLLKAATDLHGHFGPFLTLGVRIALVGLRELGAREGDTQLHVTAMLEYALPFSCMLDGIQTATKCTVGNKRLMWKESKEFGAVFLLRNSGRQVEVKVNPAVVEELKRRVKDKEHLDDEVHRLASEVGSRSEKELFLVSHK